MSSTSKKRETRPHSDGPRKGAPPPRKRPDKHILEKIALLLLSVLLSFALGEAVLRVAYGDKFGKRPGFFIGDDRLGWKPCANLDHVFYGPDYSIEVKTDADGYRLGSLGEIDYGKDLVVLCGDSFTFGWGVSTGETFASRLDELLDDASGGRMRVVNLGVGGYGTIQQFDRLRELLARHADSRIACVIVQHTVNDATDNPAAIGYHAGTWKTATKTVTRSRFHLFNLISFTVEALGRHPNRDGKDADRPDERDPFLQDMLWAYEREGRVINLPRQVYVGRTLVPLEGVLSPVDNDAEALLQRKTLTTLQAELLRASFGYLNDLLEAAGRKDAKVRHMFIYTEPDWYVEAVTDLIETSVGTGDGRVAVWGRVPGGEYDGPILNAHSGGHYNPAFSEYWARRVLALLKRDGVL